MNVDFQILGIENRFIHLFDLSQTRLSSIGVVKKVVDENPGYPCRVGLEDVEIGEEVILLSFQHHKTKSPYQASGPIFIGKNAKSPNLGKNQIPKMLLHRLLSIRVYDKKGMMIGSKTIKGEELRKSITTIFQNPLASYIHIHNSGPGCYNCEVIRASND